MSGLATMETPKKLVEPVEPVPSPTVSQQSTVNSQQSKANEQRPRVVRIVREYIV